MKLTSSIISLVAFFSFASANIVTATHNAKYDEGSTFIEDLTCSWTLKAKYSKLASLPNWPKIGGYANAACGSCWEVAFSLRNPIYVLSVDNAGDGFQVSASVLDSFGGLGAEYNDLPVTVTPVDKSKCGLSA